MQWRDITLRYPEFVQWLVAHNGPLPDGEVKSEDYEKWSTEYLNSFDKD